MERSKKTAETNLLHDVESEVKQTDSISGLDPKKIPLLEDGHVPDSNLREEALNLDDLNSTKGEQGKDGKVQNGEGLEEKHKKNFDNNDSNKDLGSKINSEGKKDEGSENQDLQIAGENEKQGSANEGLHSEVVPKEITKDRKSSLPKSFRKENPQLEDCDPSNRCVDDANKLVACLRVPGNESPDLSLLIQNKGTGSIRVDVTAPQFVQLEHTVVQLKEKEGRKVKVSIASGSDDTVIVLTAGYGHCKLDFRDVILPYSGKTVEHSSLPTYSSHLTRRSAVCFFLAIFLFIGAAWTCLRRRHDNPRYQKVETDLPISCGGKMEDGASDGWDHSWGDTWEDEEALQTPSKLVANLSSKGLAPRRSNYKDGWQNSWKD